MDHGFHRDVLDNAFQLRVLPHQIVLMGATIPDAMERYLVDQFEVNNYKRILRPASTGQNCNWSLKTWNKIDLTFSPRSEEISSDSFLSSSENRFIIFGTTLEDGDYLEERLDLPVLPRRLRQSPHFGRGAPGHL
ncbi:hypothetical protein B0H14DRAFT_3518486 [Mycena olivaceomarginata]|nr:hypothetical protein B0H14DRAFT_3518486 [Mycena olivaceomarginata]